MSFSVEPEGGLGNASDTLHQKSYADDSDGEEFACNAGGLGLIPGLGRSSGGGYGNSLQYSCLENPHGQRRLVSYNP